MPISFNKLVLGGGAGGVSVGKLPIDLVTPTPAATEAPTPTPTATLTPTPTPTTGALYAGTYLLSWGDDPSYAGSLDPKGLSEMTVVGDVNWNDWAQLADIPVTITSITSAGGIKEDSSAWIWGTSMIQPNYITGYSASSPMQEITRRSDWSKISCGRDIFAGITNDNRLYVYGKNNFGQLGIKDTINRYVPTTVNYQDTNWSKVFTGYATYAIKTDGTLWAWGRNTDGQLGFGDKLNRSSPVQIGNSTDWYHISNGDSYALALKGSSGNYTLWAWGNNSNGRLGLNDIAHRSSPVQVGSANDWEFIKASYNYSIGKRTTGNTVFGWGNNANGQLGINNRVHRSSPVVIGTGGNWGTLATGWTSRLYLNVSDGVYQTGAGWYYDGSAWTSVAKSSPVQILSNASGEWQEILQIGTEVKTALILANFSGNAKPPAPTPSPTPVIQQGQLIGWGYHSMILMEQADMSGNTTDPSPVVISSSNNWKKLPENCGSNFGGGVTHMGAIKTDNTLWMWGQNGNGSLGLLDTTISTSSPIQITNYTWSTLTLANYCTVAIKSDGSLWSWGANSYGQLGLGDVINRSSPVQIGSNTNWTQLSSVGNGLKIYALNSSGEIWAWGQGNAGNFGNNSLINRSSPVQVLSSIAFTKVIAGNNHVLALDVNYKLWTWGSNSSGQLGTNNTTSRSSPVLVSTTKTWISISAALQASYAIDSDNKLWAWGNAYLTTASASSPVQIGLTNSNYQNINSTICTVYRNNSSYLGFDQITGGNSTVPIPGLQFATSSDIWPLHKLESIKGTSDPSIFIGDDLGLMIT
jgi:alpha-tubulin suppressor-like RCC1 family protein